MMGKVIGSLFMVVGIIFVLTGLSVVLVPETSNWIMSVLPIGEGQLGISAFWLLANWLTLLIGGGVLFWIGKSLRD